MKSVFISFDQALHEPVMEALKSSLCRGYTFFPGVGGCGSETGDPHLGSHAWPTMNEAILTVCEDSRVDPLLQRLRKIDSENSALGLRAFVWAIEQSI